MHSQDGSEACTLRVMQLHTSNTSGRPEDKRYEETFNVDHKYDQLESHDHHGECNIQITAKVHVVL